MLIVGYCCGIRSERRLCDEVHLNLAYRWFCRLDLGDPCSRPLDVLKKTVTAGSGRATCFRTAVSRTCWRAASPRGLVGADAFGVDASLIKGPTRAATPRSKRRIGTPPEQATRAVQEYLDTLDDAAFRRRRDRQCGPKALSPSDPAARFTGANGDRAFFAYSTNYLVDLENAIIVDVEATAPIRQAEARRGADDDPARQRPVWSLSRDARRRHRLWLSRHAGLAGRGRRDRAAHPGL